MRSKPARAIATAVIATLAIAAAAAVAIAIGRFWDALGAAEISLAGWLAMGFGVVVTLALGVGLMALMFFSSRHGYDDVERQDGRSAPPLPQGGDADSAAPRAERQPRGR
jgi:hypothetical protein